MMGPKGVGYYLYSYYITCGLLLPLYAIVLTKTYKGASFKFVRQTVQLLMLYNVSAILFAASNQIHPMWLGIGLNSSMVFVKDASFNLANWVFSFKYYKIARAMPFALVGEEVPAKMVKQEDRLNKIFLALNFFLPLGEGVSYLLSDFFEINLVRFDF